MLTGIINFSKIPKIGFSHYFYTDKEYRARYGREKSLEIAYIESGSAVLNVEGERLQIDEGCFLILFRHLPMELHSDGRIPFAHCCMQLVFDYDFEMLSGDIEFKNMSTGLVLPFVTPACKETEELKKMLFSAVRDFGISEKNELSSALSAMAILQRLSNICKKNLREKQDKQSLIEYKVKKYVASNLSKKLTIAEIAKYLKRTPNYINSVFKKECGISIGQYINQEKVKFISEIIQKEDVSFKVACENAGINDVSYGYRIFKKHAGITPKEYIFLKRK